jgi:hypothetical protein
MCDQRAKADALIAELAARQYGVVTVGQLRSVGVDKHRVRHRVRVGRLHSVHRGVYAVGHAALAVEGRWMAAVLACGGGAVLSHGSAAALWDFLRPIEGPIHVSVPTANGRGERLGIVVHRCSSLTLGECTRRKGIPVTNPARTIEDLRGSVPPQWVRRAIRQAQMQGRRLGPDVETDRTRSDLERDFLGLCRRYELPWPQINVRIGRWTVDFLWRSERVAVESDSYRWHRGSVAFEDDHARDLDLRRRGFDIRRFTESQIRDEPAQVAADLRDALGLAS